MGGRRDRQQTRGRRPGGAAALFLDVTGLLLVLAVILCYVPLTLPRLAGLQIFEVVSGSMEPAIPTGSIVYVEETEPSQAEEGDVIAFYSATGSGAVITHRVVQNRVVSGELVTKGDANEKEDVTPVSYEYYLGKVVFTLPGPPGLFAAVLTLPGRITAAALVVLAAALHGAAVRMRRD